MARWSNFQPLSCLCLNVSVEYGTPLNAVRSALFQAAQTHSDVLSEPGSEVLLKQFQEDTIELELQVWVRSDENPLRILSALYFHINTALVNIGVSPIRLQQAPCTATEPSRVELSPEMTTVLLKAYKAIEPERWSLDRTAFRQPEMA
ncbi:MAG: hypothetical protein ABG776_01165 [Cyanobacteria bacterium J06555_13]